MFCMALSAVVLLCGGCRQRATFGGVVIPESPWSFAAALDEQGNGLFLIESVEKNADKAIVNGWYDTCAAPLPHALPSQDHYVPAKIFCDLSNGRITYITVYCDDEQQPRFTLNLQSKP